MDTLPFSHKHTIPHVHRPSHTCTNTPSHMHTISSMWPMDYRLKLFLPGMGGGLEGKRDQIMIRCQRGPELQTPSSQARFGKKRRVKGGASLNGQSFLQSSFMSPGSEAPPPPDSRGGVAHTGQGQYPGWNQTRLRATGKGWIETHSSVAIIPPLLCVCSRFAMMYKNERRTKQINYIKHWTFKPLEFYEAGG